MQILKNSNIKCNVISKLLITFAVLLFVSKSNAQTKKPVSSTQSRKIEIKNADGLYFDEDRSDAKILKGNVIFFHEGTHLYCDSAYYYDEANSLDAFGNVHIQHGDSVHAYGNTLKYDGNSKMAILEKDCKLTDKDMVLTSDNLFYNTKANIADYYNGGKLVNKQNTLTSKSGHYYANKREVYFNDDVVLVNKDYTINTDTMRYNTSTKTSFFFGPTTIKSKDNLIYCENGWYNTDTEKAQFSKRAWLRNKEQRMRGDSMYYDRKLGLGKGFRNVEIIDTTQKVTVKGDYIEYWEKQNKSLATGRAVLIQKMENDSLFLHADTLRAIYDTTQGANKTMWAYHHVRFYSDDMQGQCDSMVYAFKDSLIHMFKAPVLWSEDKQLTAEKVEIKTYEGKVYNLFLTTNSYIIAEKDTDKYDQIKGKNMTGYFTDNKLSRINVKGNGQTIYYAREDKKAAKDSLSKTTSTVKDSTGKETVVKGEYIGANKATCTDLIIFLKDNEVKSITFLNKPEATLFPLKEVKPEEFKFKGFKWRIGERPKDKTDIFPKHILK